MRAWTYAELEAKVQKDLDMQEELFVTPTEMMGYCNEAIDEAEAEIMKIHEDYFLTSDSIALVNGTSDYDLPDDIYAQKIRGITYNDGSQVYEVRRIRNYHKFLRIAESGLANNAQEDYQYYLKNPGTADGYQMVLVPPSREDSSDNVTLWYIRNAERITDSGDVLDIPEFANFVMAYMKAMCRAKENGGEMPSDAAALVQQQRKQMVDTLTEQVPDDDNTVQMDLSHYWEHS